MPPVSTHMEEGADLKIINNKLIKGDAESAQLLQEFLETCSDRVFSENCIKWMQWCCKIDGKNSKDITSILRVFSRLIILSRKVPELGRPIANSVTTRYFDVFVKNLIGLPAGWETLEVLMTSYNTALAANKETLENLLAESLESSQPITPYQCKCYALLPSLGGGGADGVNHKANWRQQMDRLILECQKMFQTLLRDIAELGSFNNSGFNLPDGGLKKLERRLSNTASVIQSMLLMQYPSEKCVPAQEIFTLIHRGVSLIDENNSELNQFLPEVLRTLLETLTALIVACQRSLLPFATVLVKLLDLSLRFSEKFPELRNTVYTTLCNWMVVVKTGSCVDKIIKNLMATLLNDIQTKRKVIILRGKGKKKENDCVRNQLPLSFNEPLCYTALKTLDILLKTIGFLLPPAIHKDTQVAVVEILLSVKKHGEKTPLYGESARCRSALYQVLLQLCLEPCPRWPPPTQFALRLLRYGQEDVSPHVASVCTTALSMIDRIIHPEFSVAAFPVNYNKTLEEFRRLEEEALNRAVVMETISSDHHVPEQPTDCEIPSNQEQTAPIYNISEIPLGKDEAPSDTPEAVNFIQENVDVGSPPDPPTDNQVEGTSEITRKRDVTLLDDQCDKLPAKISKRDSEDIIIIQFDGRKNGQLPPDEICDEVVYLFDESIIN